ncbi:MAG: FeoB-associated Cys-rich membrane protein [Clostridia bacterium]|nr:FeoB-associated Cys-rich membrane protein [Clostridia bacterium]
MWPTVVVGILVAVLFVAIIINLIRKKKKGKSNCSCGGNCGLCSMGCKSDNKE